MDEGAAGRAPGLGARRWLGVTWARLGTLAEPQSACLSSGSIMISPRSPMSGAHAACVSVTFFLCVPHHARIGAVNKTDIVLVKRGNSQ